MGAAALVTGPAFGRFGLSGAGSLGLLGGFAGFWATTRGRTSWLGLLSCAWICTAENTKRTVARTIRLLFFIATCGELRIKISLAGGLASVGLDSPTPLHVVNFFLRASVYAEANIDHRGYVLVDGGRVVHPRVRNLVRIRCRNLQHAHAGRPYASDRTARALGDLFGPDLRIFGGFRQHLDLQAAELSVRVRGRHRFDQDALVDQFGGFAGDLLNLVHVV